MTPQTLISLTAAHGISISRERAADLAAEIVRLRLNPWFTPGEIRRGYYLDGSVRWCDRPKSDRVSVAPEWSMADAGLAAKGVPQRCWYAAIYRYTRDVSVYHDLKNALIKEGQAIGRAEGWPGRIEGREYIPVLAALALIEEHAWWWIRATAAWPVFADTDEETWRRRYSRRYEALRSTIEDWCGKAESVIRQRIGTGN